VIGEQHTVALVLTLAIHGTSLESTSWWLIEQSHRGAIFVYHSVKGRACALLGGGAHRLTCLIRRFIEVGSDALKSGGWLTFAVNARLEHCVLLHLLYLLVQLDRFLEGHSLLHHVSVLYRDHSIVDIC